MSNLTECQAEVLEALSTFPRGIDDQGLAAFVHHISDVPMSSSGVRSRRAELVRKGLVTVVGLKTTKSGRQASIHALTIRGKQVLRAQRRRQSRALVAA
jgi:hypothetical protein